MKRVLIFKVVIEYRAHVLVCSEVIDGDVSCSVQIEARE